MTQNNANMELTGLERFSHLEDKIFRVAEAFRTMQKENESLRGENVSLKREIEELRRNQAAYDQNLEQLQRERESLRERVEKALNLLATLEVR
jgi:FtsZ-binding cell division protein ZapB